MVTQEPEGRSTGRQTQQRSAGRFEIETYNYPGDAISLEHLVQLYNDPLTINSGPQRPRTREDFVGDRLIGLIRRWEETPRTPQCRLRGTTRRTPAAWALAVAIGACSKGADAAAAAGSLLVRSAVMA